MKKSLLVLIEGFRLKALERKKHQTNIANTVAALFYKNVKVTACKGVCKVSKWIKSINEIFSRRSLGICVDFQIAHGLL